MYEVSFLKWETPGLFLNKKGSMQKDEICFPFINSDKFLKLNFTGKAPQLWVHKVMQR